MYQIQAHKLELIKTTKYFFKFIIVMWNWDFQGDEGSRRSLLDYDTVK
jgi:hypothetical protein